MTGGEMPAYQLYGCEGLLGGNNEYLGKTGVDL
jgi:hypothetical protein